MTKESIKVQFAALQVLLGSFMKALEVMCVVQNIKPVARILCHQPQASTIRKALSDLGLQAARAGYKLLLEHGSSSYVDKATRVSLDHPSVGHEILYIAKSSALANQAQEKEHHQQHVELGLLLGYPLCCAEFFAKKFSEHHTDLTLDMFEASPGYEFPYEMNIAARHMDMALLSHFPHSFFCEPSQEQALKRLELLKENMPKAMVHLNSILKSAVIYTEQEGVHVLIDPKKKIIGKDISIEYKEVLSTLNNKLHYALSEQSKITIKGKASIGVGELVLDKKAIMLFIEKGT